MEPVDKKSVKSPYPPYDHSAKYYTDQIHFAEANYGCDENELSEELTAKKDQEAPDEPVESWGWVNNVD